MNCARFFPYHAMYFAYRALSLLRSARETAFPPFSSAAKRARVLSEKLIAHWPGRGRIKAPAKPPFLTCSG